MNILAIETSCDETACAVVRDGTKIISNVVASSSAMHEKYGGIVPEVAAREQLKCIIPVIREALKALESPETFHAIQASESSSDQASLMNEVIKRNIDAIAVTVGPGLIGSLLVGVETAKTIAFVTGKPIIPVNHVLAHMYANFVGGKQINFPAISLVVSGGHTELYLMKSTKDLTWLGGTLDDAAGECFDKTARLLGFGHGGGLAIEKAASKKSDLKVKLPRPMMDGSFNFSFSGLKTAVMREWKKANNPNLAPAFAHEIQESITDVLVEKTLRAAKQYHAKSILLSGGVASNIRLREKFSILNSQFSIHAPLAHFCTDNAVMIGACASFLGSFTLSKAEGPAAWRDITATPDLSVELS